MHTAYIAGGNATGRAALKADATTTAYLWLGSVDVLAPAGRRRGRRVRRLDHRRRRRDARHRSRLAVAARGDARGRRPAGARSVVNVGLSGNRLLRPGFGVSALARFDRDVLGHAGVRWMTVLLGINDITFPAVPGAAPGEAVTADDLIWGLQQIIERAHRHGIKVAGATIMPVEGVNTYTDAGERIRQDGEPDGSGRAGPTTRSSTSTRRYAIRPTRADCVPTSIPAITCIRTMPATRRWPRRLMRPSSGDSQGDQT